MDSGQPQRRRVPKGLRVGLLILLGIAVVYVLFTVVFPWLETYFENPSIQP